MTTNPNSLGSGTSIPFFKEAFKFLEFVVKFYRVGEETDETLKAISHVTHDLENVRRLRRSRACHLNTHDLAWVDRIIKNTEDAIGGLGRLVERVRVAKETKDSVGLFDRARWVCDFGPKVNQQIAKLTMCHNSLLHVCHNLLHTNAKSLTATEDTEREDSMPSYDAKIETWLDWQNQRQRRSRGNMVLRGGPKLHRRTSSSSTSSAATASSMRSPSWATPTTCTSVEEPSLRDASDKGSYLPLHFPHTAKAPIRTPSTEVCNDDISNDYLESSAQGYPSPTPLAEFPSLAIPNFGSPFQGLTHGSPSTSPIDHITTNAPTARRSFSNEDADGLQVCQLDDDLGQYPAWSQQLATSLAHTHESSSHDGIKPEHWKKLSMNNTKAARSGQTLDVPTPTDAPELPEDDKETNSATSYLTSPYCPKPSQNYHNRIRSITNKDQDPPAQQFIHPPEHLSQFNSSWDHKPYMQRTRSDVYTPQRSPYNRPSITPSDAFATIEGRSMSDGPSGIGRGSRGWLSFHASRTDLGSRDGWGDV